MTSIVERPWLRHFERRKMSVLSFTFFHTEGDGSVHEATDFGSKVASIVRLPKTYVADVALVKQRGWAVVEFNSTWGSGLNGGDPDAVADCLVHATLPDSR